MALTLSGSKGGSSPQGASQLALVGKNSSANAGNTRDTGSIPGSGRSPAGGHGNPLWYSCLKNCAPAPFS